MNDNVKALMHQFEMAAHSQGAAQFLYNLFGGGCITKQQAKEMIDFCISKMKCNIESNPNLTREQKDYEISIRESWFNGWKISMGLN